MTKVYKSFENSTIMKKIFKREDGSYTFDEYTNEKMNASVVPQKYSPTDKYGAYRRKANQK